MNPINLKDVKIEFGQRYKILSIDGTAVSQTGPNIKFKATFRLEAIDGFERLVNQSAWGVMLRNGRIYHINTRDNEALFAAYGQWCKLAMEIN